VTIELETFYSRRLGSFCWDHVGERVKGRWGGGLLPSEHDLPLPAPHGLLSSSALPGARPQRLFYSGPL
jgi:hypothetical protein